MSDSKASFHLSEIDGLVKAIKTRENVKSFSQTMLDLDWIKYHARQLVSKCDGCDESKNDTDKSETID